MKLLLLIFTLVSLSANASFRAGTGILGTTALYFDRDSPNQFINGSGSPIGNRSTYNFTIAAWVNVTTTGAGTRLIYRESPSQGDTNNVNNILSLVGTNLCFD